MPGDRRPPGRISSGALSESPVGWKGVVSARVGYSRGIRAKARVRKGRWDSLAARPRSWELPKRA